MTRFVSRLRLSLQEMPMTCRCLVTSAFLSLAAAGPAAAQSPVAGHTQSIGAGVHWSYPDSGATMTPGIHGAWRRWFRPGIGVEADVRFKRLHAVREFNTPEQRDPFGGLVLAQQGRDERHLTSYGVGASVIGRLPAGRLSLIVGGGPGLLLTRGREEHVMNSTHSTRRVDGTRLALRGLGEVDVRLTERVSVFAALRIELFDARDAEGTVGYPSAGLRVAF